MTLLFWKPDENENKTGCCLYCLILRTSSHSYTWWHIPFVLVNRVDCVVLVLLKFYKIQLRSLILFTLFSTDLFLERPRSASVNLLIETSEMPNDITPPIQQIQRTATENVETDETSYFVIGECGETSTDDLTKPPGHSVKLRTKASSQRPAEGHSRLLDKRYCHAALQTEVHQRAAPKRNKTSKVATDPFYFSTDTNSILPLPPTLHLSNQQDQKSLHDSALSYLIDAMSLGNEYDTCGSISALIGQFEVTAEQSNLNLSLGSQPPQLSLPPMTNQLFSTPQKMIQDLPQKAKQSVENHLPCSPETTESTVFTILDEEELSPVSVHDISNQTVFKNLECTSPNGRTGLSKIPFRGTIEENSDWESHTDKSYKPQCPSLAFSRDYECYKDTSINSTASERFLICQDSANSSLMEVEVNVDGEPLETTLNLEPPHLPPSMNKQNSYELTKSSLFHSSSQHQSFVSRTDQSHYPVHQSQAEQCNRNNVTMSGHFKPDRYNEVTYNNRHFETRNNNGDMCNSQYFQNGFSSSECLLRSRDINSKPHTGSYMPGSDSDMIYSSVKYRDTYVPSKQYLNSVQQPQPLELTHSEIYKGIYLVGSPVPTSPSPCKSKSLGDLTSEDISSNFQSKYKVISRSFITPAMGDQKRMCVRANQPQSSDPLTEQLRKLVTLDDVEPYPKPSQLQSTPKSLSVFPPVPVNTVSTDDSNERPPFLSRKLSSRSQSRVRHIASRARERQQEALKLRPTGGTPDVVLRNKAVSFHNSLINRHSTGSYIAGYLEHVGVEDRGLPEGSCKTICYGYPDQCYTDDSMVPHNSCSFSEPEVYFLLRI